MISLELAAYKIMSGCMQVKFGESILIVTDKKKLDIAQSIYNQARKVTKKVKLIETPIARVNGEEPPKEIAQEMLYYDVILIPTTRSISHTKARRAATAKGARIATMPGITKKIMMRTMEADYQKILDVTKKLSDLFNKGNHVRIHTEKGTELSLSIVDRLCFGDTGIYPNKGMWGNLPAGEACLAPVEGSTNGVLIVDGSALGKRLKNNNIKIKIKDGYATYINGSPIAYALKQTLKPFGKNAFAVAELGIGTNDKAIITGKILEDEKVFGTAHIAFGNNLSFGGRINVPIHQDVVFMKPTIYLDNKKIIENGFLLI